MKIKKGQKFGKLTAIEYDNKNFSPPKWKCICECGKTIYVRTALLNNGQVKSCGCSRIRDGISKNKHYKSFKKYNQRHQKNGLEKFTSIQDYILYRNKKSYINHEKLENMMKKWWNIIEKDKNEDFSSFVSFMEYCKKRRINRTCFSIKKKNNYLPFSKKNLEIGIFYKRKFIPVWKFHKLHFNYDENKKLFYGYIKYKGHTIITKTYKDFNLMVDNYIKLYEFYFDKKFTLT